VLPSLPLHGGDRNRTSPFAFTGTSSSSGRWEQLLAGVPQHGVEHDRGRSGGRSDGQVESGAERLGATLEKAVTTVVKDVWAANKQVVFDGDGYSDAWHKEAEKRGLANLKTTPDALPWIVDKQTIAAFKKYKVLTKRELESRCDVFTEQYVMNINIEPRRPLRSLAR